MSSWFPASAPPGVAPPLLVPFPLVSLSHSAVPFRASRPSSALLALTPTPPSNVAIESTEERAARLLRNRLLEATEDAIRIELAVDAAIELLEVLEAGGATKAEAQGKLLAVVADVQSRIWSSVPAASRQAENADDVVRTVVAAAIWPARGER